MWHRGVADIVAPRETHNRRNHIEDHIARLYMMTLHSELVFVYPTFIRRNAPMHNPVCKHAQDVTY